MLTRRFLLAGAAIVVSLACASSVLADHADLEPTGEPGADMPVPRRYMMEDLYGNVMTNEDFAGRYLLIYFGYTGCPDVCPTSLSTMADALDLLGAEAAQVTPIFVTVDPDRDTAKLMQDYLAFFDERIVGLRGPGDYTNHMVKTFNARYEKHVPDPAHPDRYSIDHTASIALLDPLGVLIKRYPHGMAAAEIAQDMRAVIAEASAQ